MQFQPTGKAARKATLYVHRGGDPRGASMAWSRSAASQQTSRRRQTSCQQADQQTQADQQPASSRQPADQQPAADQHQRRQTSTSRRGAAFPCRFACCFLAFCDFSPAQAGEMRLFLCKREGVFGSRRQCPRDRAPLSCESPRVLNVGVLRWSKSVGK